MHRYLAAIVLIATLGVTTTMHESTIGIKAALVQCAGTLGSIHFERGHVMALPSRGVDTQLSTQAGGRQKIVFQDQMTRRTAVITVDGARGVVLTKNVLGKPNMRIMCILPD